MNLIDEQDGRSLVEETTLLGLVDDLPDILYATGHRTERIKRGLHPMGDDLGQCGLAHTRRSPKDERGDATGIDHTTQNGPFSHQMTLADILIESCRTHSFC